MISKSGRIRTYIRTGISNKRCDTWIELLTKYDIIFAPVYDMSNIQKDKNLMDSIPKVKFLLSENDEELISIGISFVYNNEMIKTIE